MLFFKLAETLHAARCGGYRISVILRVRALGGQNPTINRYYGKPREKNAQAQSLPPPNFPVLHLPPSDEAKAKAVSSVEPRAGKAAESHPGDSRHLDSHNTAS